MNLSLQRHPRGCPIVKRCGFLPLDLCPFVRQPYHASSLDEIRSAAGGCKPNSGPIHSFIACCSTRAAASFDTLAPLRNNPSLPARRALDMIGSLRGKLVDKRPNQVLLEVGGVGYQVQIPLSTFAGLGSLETEATLLTYTHVREDALSLYGFLTAREKHCFELLISASGVGPSLALKILSGMAIDDLVPAIRKGDFAQLVRIPGVGRKTAERIVVELRDKLVAIDVPETGKPATRSEIESQVKATVANLGYEARAIDMAIEKLSSKVRADFDTLLRELLQQLGSGVMHKKRPTGQLRA